MSGREDLSSGKSMGRTRRGDFEVPDQLEDDGVEGSTGTQLKRVLKETLFGRASLFKKHQEGDSSMDSSFSSRLENSARRGSAWPLMQKQKKGAVNGDEGGAEEVSTSSAIRKAVLKRASTVVGEGFAKDMLISQQQRESLGKFIVSPDNTYVLLLRQVLLLLAAYSIIITPLEFAFFEVYPLGLAWTDAAVNMFFFVDLVLTFFVAYKDKKTYVLVADHKRIALNYLRNMFLLDLLSLFPWNSFYQLTDMDGAADILRWMIWVRLSRCWRCTEFFKKLQRDIRLSYFMVRITKLLLVELFITHVAGCFFYYLATTYPPDEEGYTWIGSLTLGNFSYENFRSISLFTRYITALYWAVVTMATIGYGDIHPVNPREMIFAMAFISLDLILGAYIVGNITALVVKGSNTERYRERMAMLIKYMNRNHLPHALRHQMRQHVRLQFETEQVEDDVLDEFPISIRHKVFRSLYQRVVDTCYLFHGCSEEFKNQIVSKVTPEYFFPSEVVFQQRDTADSLYIVYSGAIEEITKHRGEEESVLELGKGQAFGEVALLCNIPQPSSVRVRELSQVLRLEKAALNAIVSVYMVDGRQMVDNLLERTKEVDSKFADMSSEIIALIAQQEAELVMTTIYAASRGDIGHLQQLVKAGANVAKADYDGRSPLHLAAAGGFNEIVNFLILEGADINARDNFGTTPLLEALRAGHDNTAKILLEKGGSVNLQEAGTDLCNAVIHGDTGLLTRLLEHGVDPNAADYDLRTPLHIAASEGFLLVTKLLVEHGADVAAKDRWGNTALDEARRSGSVPLVKYLEEAMAKKLAADGAKQSEIDALVKGGDNSNSRGEVSEASGHETQSISSLVIPEQQPHLGGMASGATTPNSLMSSPRQRIGMMAGGPRRSGGVPRPGGPPRPQIVRKRVTLYGTPPWAPKRGTGKLVWLPSSFPDLMDTASSMFANKFDVVVNEDGAEYSSLDLIGDGERLFFVTTGEIQAHSN